MADLAHTEQPLWTPSPERVASANMTRFVRWLEPRLERTFPSYAELYQWSLAEPGAFWSALWEFCELRASAVGQTVLADREQMPGARWFPEARLNYAENVLRHCAPGDPRDALVFWGEDKVVRRVSRGALRDDVSRFAQALRVAGVEAGDRVAGYLPNMPEAIVAMLATASLGAVWSSASPDFGVQGVLDRFGQIAPKVLVCADGYYYQGKRSDVWPRAAQLARALSGLLYTVVVDYTGSERDLSSLAGAVSYREFVARFAPEPIDFAQVPFEHPLFVLYSSGTTGKPKGIVHGHGGVLLQHLKEHVLHSDVKPDDRLFYFTTCGWMMWNWLASGLASGATLLLFDGSPFVRGGRILFDYAETERMTHFGTSAKYLDALAKTGLRPREHYRLEALRVMLSTGSPLAPESFEFVYREIKSDLCLSSISGGTDIVSCFALGNPTQPVWRGELQCRGLGLAVEVFDERGTPVRGEKGELVCTRPFPSMPVGFWNDANGARYRAAYFERFPNVWSHGDLCELTSHDGLIIYGRSDAVLNPGGVRIGTAEIYRLVEQLPEVLESIAVGQSWHNDVRVVLFVQLRPGLSLDEPLIKRIKRQLREHASPRHVPAKVLQVSAIPRTRSGKLVELAVRQVIHGLTVPNLDALQNPEALDEFRDRPELLA